MWSVLYIAWVAAEVVIAVVTRTRRGQGEVHDRGTLPLLWITILASMTLAGFLRNYLPHTFPAYWSSIALGILALGLVVRCVAILSLGKAFSANVAIRSTQRVYQSGMYSVLRHPSYSGLMLVFLAVGLHSRNLITLLCAFVPPTAALLYRIHVEEIALLAAFGQEYRTYMTRTKRLVPWIY